MNVRMFLLFLAFYLPVASDVLADVIFIHGAKSKYSPWTRPGSIFFNEISTQASRLQLGKVVSFGWSGKSGPPNSLIATVKEHIAVAKKYALEIAAGLTSKTSKGAIMAPLHILVHSNGGLIAALISQMLDFTRPVTAKNSFELFISLPVSDEHAVGQEKHSYKNLNTNILKCRELIIQAVSEVRAKLRSQQKTPIAIQQLIMLGTPFDPRLYAVNMRVVDTLCFLSSPKDNIQRYFGLTRYPVGNNIVNFRIAIKAPSGGIFFPMHSNMMYLKDGCIPRALLELFSQAQSSLGLSSQNLALVKEVDVLFDQSGLNAPLFKILKSISAD